MTQSGTNESDVGPDPRGRTGPPVGGNAQQAAGEDVPVPPYEGRTTADARGSADDEPEERLRRAEGVHPGSVTEALTDPGTSLHGRTETPADEQPAAHETVTQGSDPGTGPAHYPGPRAARTSPRRRNRAARRPRPREPRAGRPVSRAVATRRASTPGRSTTGPDQRGRRRRAGGRPGPDGCSPAADAFEAGP